MNTTTVHFPGLRRFISSSQPLRKAYKVKHPSKRLKLKLKSKAARSPQPPSPAPSEPKPLKLRMQNIPRWDDGWGTKGPRKDPVALAARQKAQEDAEKEKQRVAQREAEKARLASLRLSNVKYADAIKDGKLARRLEGKIPYTKMTALQVEALGHLNGGNNVFIQSTNLGMTTSYLVPVISKYVQWEDASEDATSKPQDSWMSYDTIARLGVKKGHKKLSAELLDSGPNSIRVIIVSPTSRSAENIARKCRGLVPSVEEDPRTSQKMAKGAIRVICLTHDKPSQSEREAVLSRRSHILVTTPFPLLDHFINTKSFRKSLSRLRCVVFDRADEFPHPDWLPALRESLVLEDNSVRQCVVTARQKTKSLDTVSDLFLSSSEYSSATI